MNIVHIAGDKHNNDYTEIWGSHTEMTELENDTDKINELSNQQADTIFFVKEEAEVYYLDKETKKFKVLGE
ncbi:MAG: hypothetical protein KBT03_08880 [Bacteroidales bacterium]|nr:hypothetical protein [Candidatus Scybalousia scybalohippi]